MKRDDFIKTYLEGAALAPYGDLMYLLVVYDTDVEALIEVLQLLKTTYL